MSRLIRLFWATTLITTVSTANAKDEAPRAKVFDQVVACRAITDGAARLACFDREVAGLDTAEREHQVTIVDSDQVREAKRSLFGLRLPNIRLFRGNGRDADEVTTITSKIASFRFLSDGRISFTLPDGANWLQEDDRILAGTLDPGTNVTIRRGALGSFIAAIEHRPGFKVHRTN